MLANEGFARGANQLGPEEANTLTAMHDNVQRDHMKGIVQHEPAPSYGRTDHPQMETAPVLRRAPARSEQKPRFEEQTGAAPRSGAPARG